MIDLTRRTLIKFFGGAAASTVIPMSIEENALNKYAKNYALEITDVPSKNVLLCPSMIATEAVKLLRSKLE